MKEELGRNILIKNSSNDLQRRKYQIKKRLLRSNRIRQQTYNQKYNDRQRKHFYHRRLLKFPQHKRYKKFYKFKNRQLEGELALPAIPAMPVIPGAPAIPGMPGASTGGGGGGGGKACADNTPKTTTEKILWSTVMKIVYALILGFLSIFLYKFWQEQKNFVREKNNELLAGYEIPDRRMNQQNYKSVTDFDESIGQILLSKELNVLPSKLQKLKRKQPLNKEHIQQIIGIQKNLSRTSKFAINVARKLHRKKIYLNQDISQDHFNQVIKTMFVEVFGMNKNFVRHQIHKNSKYLYPIYQKMLSLNMQPPQELLKKLIQLNFK